MTSRGFGGQQDGANGDGICLGVGDDFEHRFRIGQKRPISSVRLGGSRNGGAHPSRIVSKTYLDGVLRPYRKAEHRDALEMHPRRLEPTVAGSEHVGTMWTQWVGER